MIAKNRVVGELIGIPMHIILGGILCPIIGVVLEAILSGLARLVDVKLAHSALFDLAFGPLAWMSALPMGWVVNRRMRQRSACWIGALFGVIFMLVMFWSVSGISKVPYYQQLTKGHYWKYEYEQLVAVKPACGDDECLAKLLFTTPTVNGIAYSLGASFALRSEKRKTLVNLIC